MMLGIPEIEWIGFRGHDCGGGQKEVFQLLMATRTVGYWSCD